MDLPVPFFSINYWCDASFFVLLRIVPCIAVFSSFEVVFVKL